MARLPRTKTFTTRAEAWSKQIESETGRGVFVSRAEAENTTLAEALDRYAREALPTKKSTRPVTYQIPNVREGLGALSLAAITSSALAKYRDRTAGKGVRGADRQAQPLARLARPEHLR